jgi:dCTP diphosphatase
MDFIRFQKQLSEFAEARDWNQYHSPKNLASALSIEAAELLEPFQWMTEDESRRLDPHDYERVTAEMADVLIYLLRLADVLGIDLEQAVIDKILVNAKKYPVDLAKGNAVKYNRR